MMHAPKELHPGSVSASTLAFPLACPRCRQTHHPEQATACKSCGQEFTQSDEWIDLCTTANEINDNTQAAYVHYSRFYAPIALLVYLFVFRGNFLKHVGFFRSVLARGKNLVDVATGDGSLTKLALFGKRGQKAQSVVIVDISGNMLRKARKKIPRQNSVLVRGDAMHLPFASEALPLVTCFGGFNSFPDGAGALAEMARVLAPGGVLRGSVLLLPHAPWKKKLIRGWIEKGYQTEEVTMAKFAGWVRASGLALTSTQRYGDVLLFELVKTLT